MSNSNPSRPKSAPHLAYADARHVLEELPSWPSCDGRAPPWVTRALHAIHRARPCLHVPYALLPMRRGTSTPSPSPSPLPARSLSRSPRSRAAVRHGRRLKLAAAVFPCLRPPSTQMDRRTTFLSSRRPRCAPSSVLLAVCLLRPWSHRG